MKKILFGLISVSMISFAAQPTISGDAAENTPVFQTGQTGKIAVKGSLSSQALDIKYVVFSSTDGNYNQDGATWDLPPFYVSATVTDNSQVGFAGVTPSKLYVRRVDGTNTGTTDLAPNEVVSFKINVDPAYTDRTAKWMNSTNGVTVGYGVTTYIPETVLSGIASKAGLFLTAGGAIGNNADPSQSGFRGYYPSKTPVFKSTKNGELLVEVVNTPAGADVKLPADKIKLIETALASGADFGNVTVGVKVE